MLDQTELTRMRGRILGFLVLALAMTVAGASISVTVSDAAYTAAILLIIGTTAWVIHWAQSSRLVRTLIAIAIALLVMCQTLDLSENFPAIAHWPVLGSNSYWNGRLASLGFLAGLVVTFTALMFALVEARLGRISEDYYRLLADNISDVIQTMDLDLQPTYVSPSVLALRGFSPEEVLAAPPEAQWTPESLATFRATVATELDRLRRGERGPGDVVALELTCTRRGGDTVCTETVFSFLPGSGESPAGVLAVSRDITERLRADRAIRQMNSRLCLAMEAGDFGVWEWDFATGRVDWDERMYTLHGIAPGADGVNFETWRERVHPEDRDRALAAVEVAVAGHRDFHCAFRIIRPDGAIRHVEARGILRRDANGIPERMIGMNADVTDRVEIEEARKALESQLYQAQKMESVGRLAGGVAHDFNNMLLVIMGHAEIALQTLPPEDGARAHFEVIQNAALRSADLTRQLLAFARQQVISPRIVDLNLATESLLKMLDRIIGTHIHVTWKPAQDLWRVKIDPTQFDQILANLCVNARDAISGTGEFHIETRNVTLGTTPELPAGDLPPGDYVRFIFRDNGCGMDEATQARIFEPFYTTKKPGCGTGLGLSTVYGIVSQNGGRIAVSSTPGEGTTFTIDLPRYAGASAMPRSEASAPDATGGETILLVEDEPAMLNVATTMLKHLGYQVIAANEPTEALRRVQEGDAFDLLLCDVMLPEMDGPTLACRLADARGLPLPCLFMSGYTSKFDEHYARLLEEADFIEKPFGMDDLGAAIREVLARRTVA